MNCFETVSFYAEKFRERFNRAGFKLEGEEYPWRSDLWSSHHYRRAHVEEFNNGTIAVLHVTVFPTLNDASPIFGFDVISGAKRPASCYIDLSPSLETWEGWSNWGHLKGEFKNRKSPPEWGVCFSPEFVIIALEDQSEMILGMESGLSLLDAYLQRLIYNHILQKFRPVDLVREKQAFYCQHQRTNQKTFNALEKIVGSERARKYIDQILFPIPLDSAQNIP